MNLRSLKFFVPCLVLLGGCAGDAALPDSSGSIPVKVNVSVPAADLTRTSLKEEGGNLAWSWTDGDRLLVSDAAGNNVGTLNLTEITSSDGSSASFEGNLDPSLANGEVVLNFTYLGKEEPASVGNPSKSFSIASQDGLFDSLKNRDILTSTVKASKTASYVAIPDFKMSHYFSAGRFALKFTENVEIASVEISGANMKNTSSLNLGSMNWTSTDGSIIVKGSSKDIYVTLAPADAIDMTFKAVAADGKKYLGSLGVTFSLGSGIYLRKSIGDGTYAGLAVEMQPEVPETPADDTVGPTFDINGKKYKFTSGNLWYNTTTETWGIFDNQAYFYNAGGLGYKNTKADTPEFIGLFAWGATGLEDAQKPWFLKGESYTANHNGAYWPSNAGSSKNSTINNLWGNEYVYDWGRAYMESGRAADDDRQYITPSISEFKTLMANSFVQGATIKDAGMNGEDITGLLCIPGKFTLQEAKDFIRSVEGATCLSSMSAVIHNNSGNTLSYKNITLDNISVLKDLNDAIFFPAASKRNLSSGNVYNSDGLGWYWSATGGTTNSTNLFFNGKDGGFFYNGSSQSNMGRNNQMAVRLLVEVKE